MPAYAPVGQTQIACLALGKVGQQAIQDIDDSNSNSAQQCAANFWQVVRQVARAHNWNCLAKRRALTQLALPGGYSGDCTVIGWRGCAPTVLPPYWAANTAYAGGELVTWGEAIYYCLNAYTSSDNFINDVTSGYWAQIFSRFLGPLYPGTANGYEWNYAYVLPNDYVLVTELNGIPLLLPSLEVTSLYEIFTFETVNADQSISNVMALFTDAPYANIKYTALVQDPTLWDPQFVDCVATLLAAQISTTLRGDDGKRAGELESLYLNRLLPAAMMKDANERKLPRYDPTVESNFLASRYRSTNG